MGDKPRASEDERVISSKMPRKGAQVVAGSNGVSVANQKGSGINVDGQFIGLQSDIIKLSPRSVISVADAPLNAEAREELYSAEVTSATGRDRVAGEVIWGVPSVHTHAHDSIKIPAPYRSKYANRIRELKSVITRMTPLLLAVGLPGIAAVALPEIFDAEVDTLQAPESDQEANNSADSDSEGNE